MGNILVFSNPRESKLYTDVNLRQRAAEIITKIINKNLKKPIDSTEIYNIAHDEKRAERFVEANLMMESVSMISSAYVNEGYQNAITRCAGFLMYGKDRDECRAFLDKYNNLKGAKEIIHEKLKLFSNYDPTKLNDNFDEMYEEFIKNPADYGYAFQIYSGMRDQKVDLDPALQKVSDTMQGVLESFNQYNNVVELARNPISFLVPHDRPDIADALTANLKEINETFMSDPELKEVFKDFDLTKAIGEAAGAFGGTELYKKDLEIHKKLVTDGKLTKDFFLNKTFVVDKKDTTYTKAIEAIKEGKTVGVREYDEKEKEEIRQSFETNKIKYHDPDKQIEAGEATLNVGESLKVVNQYLDKFEELSKNINKTNSIFSKDTKQFKDMRDSLNAFVKKYKEVKTQIANECKDLDEKTKTEKTYEKLDKFIKDCKPDIGKIVKNTRDYVSMKTKKNDAEVKAGKKLSDRSKDRLQFAKELNELRLGKIVVDPIVQDEKTKMDAARIINTLNSKSNNQIKITKDLSKEKELEVEKVNN